MIDEKNVEVPSNIIGTVLVGKFPFEKGVDLSSGSAIHVSLFKECKLFIRSIVLLCELENLLVRSLCNM
jgi:hypothetical protein